MLSFLLITENDGPLLRTALERLAAAIAPDEDIVVIDCGSTDDTLPELTAFMASRTGELIRLEAPPPRDEAIGLARKAARHPYLLCLEARDLVHPDGIRALRACLVASEPQALVTNRTWWFGAADVVLPAPDAARIAALGPEPTKQGLLTLSPNPNRLLLHRDLAVQLQPPAAPSDPPERDWTIWEQALERAETVAFNPEPAWSSALPARPMAPALSFAATRTEPATLLRHLGWLDDALHLTGPEEALAIVAAARVLMEGLDPATLSDLQATGPMASLLVALRDDGPAMALAGLALEWAAIEQQRNRALAEGLGRLRADLDLALPGPEYLRQLYDRIRAR